MTVTQNITPELGRVSWYTNAPAVLQSGTIIANAGLVPQNASSSASAVVSKHVEHPDTPVSIKVKDG